MKLARGLRDFCLSATKAHLLTESPAPLASADTVSRWAFVVHGEENTAMTEEWKAIPGYPGYEVSDHGQVRSYFERTGGRGRWELASTPQRILSPSGCGAGYLGIGLCKDGNVNRCHIAHLVLLAFVGPRPEGKEACHNDGDNSNNKLENLRYDTHEANMDDAVNHGVWGLVPDDIRKIRRLYARGLSKKAIGKLFDISPNRARDIATGKCYKTVGGPISTAQNRLTKDDVLSIRKKRSQGESIAVLAKQYKRSEGAISRISRGLTYKDFGGPLTDRYDLGR